MAQNDDNKVEKWARLKPEDRLQYTSRRYIHRVPWVLRATGQDKYEPYTVSIGPYHHKKSRGPYIPGLSTEIMEAHKKLFLHDFLTRRKLPDTRSANLLAEISGIQDGARNCYSEEIAHSEEDFAKMLLLDGCFILQFLCRNYECEQSLSLKTKHKGDSILEKNWNGVFGDLVLLENQIPFSVLECLFDFIRSPPLKTNPAVCSTLNELVDSFYRRILPPISICKRNPSPEIIRHLLDMLRKHVQQSPDVQVVYGHSSELITSYGGYQVCKTAICATELQEARVKFYKKEYTNGLLDIEFRDGKFKIPPFYFGELWTNLLYNIIALEQCCRHYGDEITSYALLMYKIIRSDNDVKFLGTNHIISLSMEEEEVASVVRNLCKKVNVNHFYYDGLCRQVNAYSMMRYNRWRASFMHNVIHNPREAMSSVGSFCLILTITGTVFTILQWASKK